MKTRFERRTTWRTSQGERGLSNPFPVTFDVIAQESFREGDVSFSEGIDDLLMVLDARLPLCLFHTFAEPLKEDGQQIRECHQRRKPAGPDQLLMEGDVQFDETLDGAGVSEFIIDIEECPIQLRSFAHASGDVFENTGFEDDSAIDKFFGGDVLKDGVEAQKLSDAIHVDGTDDETASGLGVEDADEFEGFGGFAQGGSADTEADGEFGFGGEPVSGLEVFLGDVGFETFGDDVPEFGTFHGFEHCSFPRIFPRR